MSAAERAAEAAERGETAQARYWARIAELVDQAPPLSAEQRDKLRVLLRPEPKQPHIAAA